MVCLPGRKHILRSVCLVKDEYAELDAWEVFRSMYLEQSEKDKIRVKNLPRGKLQSSSSNPLAQPPRPIKQ